MKKNPSFSVAKENTLFGKFIYFFYRTIIMSLFRFVWVKKITGLNNIPKNGPLILAANHQSHIDFVSIMSISRPRVSFLAGEKFYNKKVLKFFMDYGGQIMVDRQSKDKSSTMNAGVGVLKQGGFLGIFPQGTRSRNGNIEKTYVGVAKFALLTGAPVLPIGIKGGFEVFPPGAGFPKFKKVIEIHIGKPMHFKGDYKKGENRQLYRKITNEVMLEIAKLASLEYKPEKI